MPIQLGIGLSIEKDPLACAREAVRLAKNNLREQKIDLTLTFSSPEFAHPLVIKTVSDLLAEIPLVGCSSAALLSPSGITKHGLLVMLISLPKHIYLNTACAKEIKTQPTSSIGQELGEKLLYGFKETRRDLGLLFCDGLLAQSTQILLGLQQRLGMSFPLVGGCTSANRRFGKSSVYSQAQVLTQAVCGILWAGKLNFGLGVKHGWLPLGKPRSVTRASGNLVYEIDAQPAAKLYEDYLNISLVRLSKELKRISVFYPLGIYLAGEEEYLLRNILSIEDNGALAFQGDVPEGSQVRLMIGSKESCLNACRQAVAEVKKDLPRPNFLLVFDSFSRYLLLGRDACREIAIIKESLGEETPFAGIYTFGEQAPLRAVGYQGKTYFHNQTITVLGIGD